MVAPLPFRVLAVLMAPPATLASYSLPRSRLAVGKEDDDLFGICCGRWCRRGLSGPVFNAISQSWVAPVQGIYAVYSASLEPLTVGHRSHSSEIPHDLGIVGTMPAVSVGISADLDRFYYRQTLRWQPESALQWSSVSSYLIQAAYSKFLMRCISASVLCLAVVMVFPSATHRIVHTAGSIQHQHNISGLGFGLGQRGRGRQGRQGDQKIRTIGFADSFARFAQRGSGRKLNLIIRDRLVGPDTALRDAAGTLNLFPRVEGIRVDQRNSILRGRCVGGAARG